MRRRRRRRQGEEGKRRVRGRHAMAEGLGELPVLRLDCRSDSSANGSSWECINPCGSPAYVVLRLARHLVVLLCGEGTLDYYTLECYTVECLTEQGWEGRRCVGR